MSTRCPALAPAILPRPHPHLPLVAPDRVSAFDVVMLEPVLDKGRVLTQITA